MTYVESKNLPHMPWFVRDYLMDTPHLTTAQHGAYILLLGNAWIQGGYLPDDDVLLASMTRCSRHEWARMKPVVMAFWSLSKRGWSQRRLLRELRYVTERIEKHKIAGQKGGRAKASKQRGKDDSPAIAPLQPRSSHALPSHTHTHTQTQKGKEEHQQVRLVGSSKGIYAREAANPTDLVEYPDD